MLRMGFFPFAAFFFSSQEIADGPFFFFLDSPALLWHRFLQAATDILLALLPIVAFPFFFFPEFAFSL